MLYDSAFYGPQFSLDGQTINGSTDSSGCDWILTSEKGWFGKPAPKANRTDKLAARGTFVGDEYAGSRVVTLEFLLSAPSPAALRLAVHKVLALCESPSSIFPLSCTDENGLALTAQVKLDGEILVTPVSAISAACSIQVVAPDPRKLGPAHSTTASLGVAGTGGVVYSVKYPVNYGAPGTAGLLYMPNLGSAPADIALTITGPATNPFFTNPMTGDIISYSGTLGAGDTLVINTGTGSVLLNSIGRRTALSVVTWPMIPKTGALQLIFNTTNTADTGLATASWSDTYY